MESKQDYLLRTEVAVTTNSLMESKLIEEIKYLPKISTDSRITEGVEMPTVQVTCVH